MAAVDKLIPVRVRDSGVRVVRRVIRIMVRVRVRFLVAHMRHTLGN